MLFVADVVAYVRYTIVCIIYILIVYILKFILEYHYIGELYLIFIIFNHFAGQEQFFLKKTEITLTIFFS